MTLRLISAISAPEDRSVIGAVMINIDVGGIARYYQQYAMGTLQRKFSGTGNKRLAGRKCFRPLFRSGCDIRKRKTCALEGTEKPDHVDPDVPDRTIRSLWVGRSVDPSPISEFRNALTMRVMTVVFVLSVVVWFVARWVASRATRSAMN